MSWLQSLFGSSSSDSEEPTVSPSPETGFALYATEWCGYCVRVFRTIERLGLQDRIEIRDLNAHPEYRQDLYAVRGRGTVPVLRITGETGDDRWMPESRDIVAFLEREFGAA